MSASRRGQSLLLGLLLTLVVALAVFATVHLGAAVYERQQLQSTADAAALTLAVGEARALNFHAYANRAQASHYVSAMIWQSTLSFTYFTEAFLVDAYGVLRTLAICARPEGPWRVICAGVEQLPYVGPLLKAVGELVRLFRAFLRQVFLPSMRALDPDRFIGRELIPAHQLLNQGLAAVSRAGMQTALGHTRTLLPRLMPERIGTRRPAADPRWSELTECLFERAHLSEALFARGTGLEPTELSERSKIARAKRAMGAVANAARHGCDGSDATCPAWWVTDRSGEKALPIPPVLSPVRGLLGGAVWKRGQTRLLSHGFATGVPERRGGNFLRDFRDVPGAPLGMLTQGDNLGADDLYRISLGPPTLGGLPNPLHCGPDDDPSTCWGDNRFGHRDSPDRDLPYRFMFETSVWAHNPKEPARGGVHWRLATDNPPWPAGEGWQAPLDSGDEAELGLSRVRRGILGLPVWVANIRPIRDGNHPWAGVTPFAQFEPGLYEEECGAARPEASAEVAATRSSEFNQPSVWLKLFAPREARLPLERLRSVIEGGGGGGEAGTTFEPARRGAEMTVLARAQVYYHRPDTWAEPPNFFNPFWRARLAPVLQGRRANPDVRALLEELPPSMAESPQKVLTH